MARTEEGVQACGVVISTYFTVRTSRGAHSRNVPRRVPKPAEVCLPLPKEVADHKFSTPLPSYME